MKYEENVLTFLRKTENPDETLLAVCNFAAVPYENYQVGVPFYGKYSYTKCRDLEGNGILSFIAFCLPAGLCTRIYDSLSAIFFAVTVEDLFVFSIEWKVQKRLLQKK